jgi:predicted acylesterase/phospholipase RssA
MLELCGREPLRGSPGGPRCFALSSRLASGRGARRAGLEPFLFRTYARPPGGLQGTSRAELWRAVDATSAAPLMFPRARLRRMHLSDGGLVANDPTAVALREAAALWPHRPVGLVLSLGCGRVEGDPRADAKEAARLAAVAAAARGRGDARTLYVRLDPPLADAVSPIETDEARLARMEEATRAHFCASDEARWLVQRLRRRTDGPTSEQRRGGRKQNI